MEKLFLQIFLVQHYVMMYMYNFFVSRYRGGGDFNINFAALKRMLYFFIYNMMPSFGTSLTKCKIR